MPDDEKETICNARAQHAKRNIGAVGTGNDDDTAQEDTPNAQGSPSKRQHLDISNAGDHMSRGGRSYISQIRSGRRYATSQRTVSSAQQNSNMHIEANAELDSHADTTVAGSSFWVIEFTDKSCDVFPFSDQYSPMEKVPVAKVGMAYDHPITGETYILIFCQALYLGDKLEHSLICPNQARQNGVIVEYVPRHLSHDAKSTHSPYFPDEDVRLPLKLRGVISYLPTCYPSNHELDNCHWLCVTGEDEWQPYDEKFEEHAKLVDNLEENNHRRIYQVHSSHANVDLTSHIFHQCSALVTSGCKLMTTDQCIA
jgi:hypothetical protein